MKYPDREIYMILTQEKPNLYPLYIYKVLCVCIYLFQYHNDFVSFKDMLNMTGKYATWNS